VPFKLLASPTRALDDSSAHPAGRRRVGDVRWVVVPHGRTEPAQRRGAVVAGGIRLRFGASDATRIRYRYHAAICPTERPGQKKSESKIEKPGAAARIASSCARLCHPPIN